ncbi:hypothetical protein GSI_04573 [Ganoderma sinense ZZ0214-1]|uniref:F-box domain-containing protein n=1 Tax=Ganoderma sinense ZZ0214-1 TaxID=1077348 RepID=A0A2G8SH69_9APHY|nr:hypothetical protein GSI_04573 [Ganoderma sinense ZZ0214-1]
MSLHSAATILPYPELASALSEGDAAALIKLSNASQVWAYEKYISTLLAIQGSITPIDDLPPEILRMVFAYVPSEQVWWDETAWMLSLQLVCRRWRSVLLATPGYWVQGIDRVMDLYKRDNRSLLVSDSTEEDTRVQVLDLFLNRSAPYPLELTMAYMSEARCPGWRAFEKHLDRVTVFEVDAMDAADLQENILPAVTTEMKQLESLALDVDHFNMSTKGLDRWEAQNLPRLRDLTISSYLFCRATTVPSLRTVVLTGERYIESLSALLPALEGCPALATLSLHLDSNHRRRKGNKRRTPERIVDLPNLLHLNVAGTTSEIYSFLSFVSFPSTTHIQLVVNNVHRVEDPLLLLPSMLPRHHWSAYTSPNIDRLHLHKGTPRWLYSHGGCVSMRGYIQGNERLSIVPALGSNVDADGLVQFLNTFSACTLTELALDLRSRYHTSPFWASFFAALPDLRRLELLSQATSQYPDPELRKINLTIACEFLKASKGRLGTSLAWVLRAFEGCPGDLDQELWDVEMALSYLAEVGGHLERLELYIVTPTSKDLFPYRDPAEPIDLKQLATNGTASRSVARAYISRLEEAADVVVISGGWGFLEDDEQDLEAYINDDEDVRTWRTRKTVKDSGNVL